MLDVSAVRQALGSVLDPELGLDIVALGLVYDLTVSQQQITVTMTMTSAACPMHNHLTQLAEDAVIGVAGNDVKVVVDVVFEPPWTPDMMSDDAKKILGY